MNAIKSPLGKPSPHDSAVLHVTGRAQYIDDKAPLRGQLYGLVVGSPIAHGKLRSLSVSQAEAMPGIHAILTHADIPGLNDASPLAHDEELLASDTIIFREQPVALVLGESLSACRHAAAHIEMELTEAPAILSIRDAIDQASFLGSPSTLMGGDLAQGFNDATHIVEGESINGAQDHFYLETQAADVHFDDDGLCRVYSSTQHPSEVQAKVAETLDIPRGKVVVICPRMGGGFGGKETQAGPLAQLAALGASKTGRPVRIRYTRDEDMKRTGNRHDWYSKYRAGFSAEGRLIALEVDTVSNGGCSLDLSRSILQRCLFHLDNCYDIPNYHLTGRIAKTHLPSNTAFRGFGGPQGMLVIENIMTHAAEVLGMDPWVLRAKNLYGDPSFRNATPFGQPITPEENRIPRLVTSVVEQNHYAERKRVIEDFNSASRFIKRGIGVMPVKFGISFTASFLNQAGALVLIYADGSVQLNHGGTEMGQGLHTKMRAICAHELGINIDQIHLMATSTDKVPNTSATAASSGSDLNGQAVRAAALTLKERLSQVAKTLWDLNEDATLQFASDEVRAGENVISFKDLCQQAYFQQVQLSATGFYKTPDLEFDASTLKGKPFHYFAYGMALVEVEVNGLTGEHYLRKVDITHDCGNSLLPNIDIGQIEGAFAQGYGWLTMEEFIHGPKGEVITHGPSTYKIPTGGDLPEHFNVQLLERSPQENVIHGSKAVGEPPFMLAIGAVTALRHAIQSYGTDTAKPVSLSLPATSESVLNAIDAQRGQS